MNVELNQLDTPFQGIFPGFLVGKFDFIATALLMSDQLVARFAFTMPIAEGSSSTMKRKGDALTGSLPFMKTIGMVAVAAFAASAVTSPPGV